jgi:hypothetical protein
MMLTGAVTLELVNVAWVEEKSRATGAGVDAADVVAAGVLEAVVAGLVVVDAGLLVVGAVCAKDAGTRSRNATESAVQRAIAAENVLEVRTAEHHNPKPYIPNG